MLTECPPVATDRVKPPTGVFHMPLPPSEPVICTCVTDVITWARREFCWVRELVCVEAGDGHGATAQRPTLVLRGRLLSWATLTPSPGPLSTGLRGPRAGESGAVKVTVAAGRQAAVGEPGTLAPSQPTLPHSADP